MTSEKPTITKSPPAAEKSEYNIRTLAPVIRYLQDRPGGAESLTRVLDYATLRRGDFDQRVKWVSHDVFERFLEGTRKEVASDDEFMAACGFRLSEGYGALSMLFWGASPRLGYLTSERTNGFFTTAGRFEVIATTAASARLRYTSTNAESRLMCLSRQAQAAQIPTLFGLPMAQSSEHSCIARGDDACEYEFSWVLRPRWTVPVLLAMGSLFPAYLLSKLIGPAAFGLPAATGLFSAVLDGRRVATENRDTMENVAETLRKSIADEGVVRQELFALQERQTAWARLVESTRSDRQMALDRLAEQLVEMQEERNTALLGLGHDLRNPLAVVSANLHCLDDGTLSTDQIEMVAEMKIATGRMTTMLAGMMTVVRTNVNRLELTPESVSTAPMPDQIRRRATALAFGKDIRITVFSNRECPATVWIDPIALDRIIDNLLTNAAKYTDRGSIIVELDGVPDYFVLKVGDTGRGIASDAIDRIFRPGASSEAERAPNSYGVGLSAVVELLFQIGGRLEVMSKEGVGSTFWVYVPLKQQPTAKLYSVEERKSGKHLLDVVRVRRTPA